MILKQFHTQIKRKIVKFLKSILIDNGGEYKDPFEEYYKKT